MVQDSEARVEERASRHEERPSPVSRSIRCGPVPRRYVLEPVEGQRGSGSEHARSCTLKCELRVVTTSAKLLQNMSRHVLSPRVLYPLRRLGCEVGSQEYISTYLARITSQNPDHARAHFLGLRQGWQVQRHSLIIAGPLFRRGRTDEGRAFVHVNCISMRKPVRDCVLGSQ